jgi:hypothetical protein
MGFYMPEVGSRIDPSPARTKGETVSMIYPFGTSQALAMLLTACNAAV